MARLLPGVLPNVELGVFSMVCACGVVRLNDALKGVLIPCICICNCTPPGVVPAQHYFALFCIILHDFT